MAKTERTKARLLLVDDNKHLVITLSDYLTYEGFEVVSAGSAEEALKKLEQTTPDLVILDISMPGIGGIGFLNKVQKDNQTPPYPILVFSARSAMEEFFGTLDVAGFIAKPCGEVELLNKINEILTARAKKSAPSPDKTPKGKILIGEDDADVIHQLTRRLMDAGFEFHVVGTGGQVLEKAATLQPTVILIKDGLLGMHGSVVAPLVHAMPSTKNIPIILYDEPNSYRGISPYHLHNSEEVTLYLRTNDAGVLLAVIKKYSETELEPVEGLEPPT